MDSIGWDVGHGGGEAVKVLVIALNVALLPCKNKQASGRCSVAGCKPCWGRFIVREARKLEAAVEEERQR